MSLEQRLIALAQRIRAEFNAYASGTKSVENANRVGNKPLATIESEYTTAISDAVASLRDGVPTAGDTLAKLYAEIQAITGGGYATLTDVNTAIQNVIGAAPAALDTLQELAAALNNDANAVAALTTAIADKANSADVYTKTEANTLFKTISSYNTEIGNPDHDLVAEFETGLL